MTFTDAAEEVLRKVSGGKPMHYRDITEQALRRQLIKTRGRTPEDTMDARIGDEIRSRGPRSRFVRRGRGLVALTHPVPEEQDRTDRGPAGRVGDIIRRPISPNGQVSLGAEVRHRWKVDSVLIHDKGSQLVIYPVPANPIRAARGLLAGKGRHISTDEARRLGREEDASLEAAREADR